MVRGCGMRAIIQARMKEIKWVVGEQLDGGDRVVADGCVMMCFAALGTVLF
jgi:hypothetical protein